MKNSNFRNSSESLSVKKELKMLVKMSKMEYQDSSTSKMDLLTKDLRTNGRQISQQIRLKGTEILGIVGNERRSSSAKSVSPSVRQKAIKEATVHGEDSNQDSLDIQSKDELSLNVVMKGEGLIKKEIKKEELYLNSTVKENVDELLSQLFHPEEQIPARSPAILPGTNTTKSIALEPRKKMIKYKMPSKPKNSRKQKAKLSESQSYGIENARSQSQHSAEGTSLPIFPDLAVKKNLTSFDELDKEFYDIMKSKLKIDLKEKLKEDKPIDFEDAPINLEGNINDSQTITKTLEKMDIKYQSQIEKLDPIQSVSKDADLRIIDNSIEKDQQQPSTVVDIAVDVSGKDQEKRDVFRTVSLTDNTAYNTTQDVLETYIEDEMRAATDHGGVSTEIALDSIINTHEDPVDSIKTNQDKKISDFEALNIDDALKILQRKTEVSYEDIVHVSGEKAQAESRPVIIPVNNAAFVSKDALHKVSSQRKNSFLTSWTQSAKKKVPNRVSPKLTNIHHFCTSIPAIELPSNLKALSKYHHTPDKNSVLKNRQIFDQAESPANDQVEAIEEVEPRILTLLSEKNKPSEEELRLTELASKILEDAIKQSGEIKAEKSFLKLQNVINQVFGENDDDVMCLDGKKTEIKYDETRLYWTPAPPKFDLPPELVKQQLIPQYHGAQLAYEGNMEGINETAATSDEDSSSDDDVTVDASSKFRQRFINRGHGSASTAQARKRENLKKQTIKEAEETRLSDDSRSSSLTDEDNNRASPSVQSISEMRRAMAKMREDASRKKEDEDEQDETMEFAIDAPKRRALSEPLILANDAEFQKFDSGFDVSFQELKHQMDDVAELKEQILKRDKASKYSDTTIVLSTPIEDAENPGKIDDSVTYSYITHSTMPTDGLGQLSSVDHYSSSRRNTRSSTNSKLAISSKSSRKPYPKRLSTKRRQHDLEKEKLIKEFLSQPTRKISRAVSYQDMKTLNEDKRNLLARAQSLENINFDDMIACHFTGEEDGLFQWTKEQYWYQWFDELYPPSVQSEVEEDRPQTAESEVQPHLSDEMLQKIEVIHPSLKTESENDIYQLLRKEIDVMTAAIEATEAKETKAFHLCRRGACYRKIGELKNAWEDLERAIDLEPKLLDAYWHRHLLYLLQDNTKRALADLDHILKHSTTNAGAFRSRADIYKKKGDFTSAIFNYSQAIKLNPKNAEIYYERAYMFQERGDILLALEDFKEAHSLLPSRTEGIRHIGMYHFDNRSWSAAINDFSALITHEPYNSEAYTYRARAYAKLTQYPNALKDLSLAIHLDPNNSIGFFYRGCLLRKCSQRQSLQDLSTSILLDDAVNNVDAYLHRGILYNEMKRWEEAMADFEAALRLDSHIPAAHVNLGLIQMTRMNNPHMGIRRFNTAIKVDPTYVRAYICRAEASQMTRNIRAAVMDYTRAIHIRPDVTDYRMDRGKLLMEEGKFDLASYHIRQCAKMSTGAGSAPTQQQAVVHTFLKNYSQAIDLLEKTVKSKPLPHLFILLGKTKTKAKMYKEAIESFERALQLMKPWDARVDWPLQAAEVHFLIGMVYTEIVNHSMALESFNNTLKINPEFSEAYYQRGLTKMKLRHAKAIQDFNRALAYNPKFFQAFLSRAAYYGMKGRYAKAIMNCNEVIRLQPKSIRGYLYRGALKYHIKAYQLAVKDLTEAIAIDHSCNVAYFNRAICYQEMRFFQKALEDYGIVLLLERKPNIKILQNRGLLYLEIGDIYNALQDFAAASTLEPKNPKLHHTLGICYQRLGRLNDAISCFSNALDTDRFFVDALLGRGNALMDYGTTERNSLARRDYERALHLNPMCLLARVNLAYSLQVQGRFKAAWMQFTKCIELDQGFKSAYEGRSVINLQMGNSFGAFIDINVALKIEKTAEFLTNRGVINQFMGDYVNAMRDYQGALKIDPAYSLAYYNAANLYFNQRQFQQALEYYDRALGWNNTNESAFVNRAITRVMLKNTEGALEDFNKALELSPYSAHIYFNRGNLRASLASYEDAENDYTMALSLQPGDAIVYKKRADVRGKMSKKEAALKDYKTAILIQTKRIKSRHSSGTN